MEASGPGLNFARPGASTGRMGDSGQIKLDQTKSNRIRVNQSKSAGTCPPAWIRGVSICVHPVPSVVLTPQFFAGPESANPSESDLIRPNPTFEFPKPMNPTPTGKIARLPKAIREGLNRRLVDGEMAKDRRCVSWASVKRPLFAKRTQAFGRRFCGKTDRKGLLLQWIGAHGRFGSFPKNRNMEPSFSVAYWVKSVSSERNSWLRFPLGRSAGLNWMNRTNRTNRTKGL